MVKEINQEDKKSPKSEAEVEETALEEAERPLTLVEVERMLNFNRDTVVSNGVLESAKEAPETYRGTSEIHQEVTWTDAVTSPAFDLAQLGLTHGTPPTSSNGMPKVPDTRAKNIKKESMPCDAG